MPLPACVLQFRHDVRRSVFVSFSPALAVFLLSSLLLRSLSPPSAQRTMSTTATTMTMPAQSALEVEVQYARIATTYQACLLGVVLWVGEKSD